MEGSSSTEIRRTMEGTKVEASFFFLLLALVTVVFFTLLSGLFQPIFWAVLLGTLFAGMQKKLVARFNGNASRAATVSLLIILFAVLVPTMLLGVAVADEGIRLFARIQSRQVDVGAWLNTLEGLLPRFFEVMERIGVETADLRSQMSEVAIGASGFVTGLALSAGENATRFVVTSFIMIYLLFFALRDGEEIVNWIVWALPYGDDRERALFAKVAEVARATIKGTVVVGAIQGSLGGIMFAILGIDGALFWAVVMTFLSILPAVGAALVWAPAAIILAVGGSFGKGLILAIYGITVIGLVDNFLRPILVGRDTKLPDWLILLSTLGGITVYGLSGFVIGPVIASVFLAVWLRFGQRQDDYVAAMELSRAPRPEPSSQPSGEVREEPQGQPEAEAPGESNTEARGDAGGEP